MLPGETVDLLFATEGSSKETFPDVKPRLPSESVRAVLARLGETPCGAIRLACALISDTDCLREAGLVSGEEQGRELPETLRPLLQKIPTAETEIRHHLTRGIAGQEKALAETATALVAGMGRFRDRQRPRGSIFLAGPTGVGKTETARAIAAMMGGPLIRFDCNMLAGGGGDSTALLWQLFGPGKGFKGMDDDSPFAPLSTSPDAVILFDEFEKADPRLGRILLQALDNGEIKDTRGAAISLRRCFIIFTSNAGVESVRQNCGFSSGHGNEAGLQVSSDSLRRDLEARGHPPEFLARIPTWVIFEPMHRKGLAAAIELHLEKMLEEFRDEGAQIVIPPGYAEKLANTADLTLGVRPIIVRLRQRISRHLNSGTGEKVDIGAPEFGEL